MGAPGCAIASKSTAGLARGAASGAATHCPGSAAGPWGMRAPLSRTPDNGRRPTGAAPASDTAALQTESMQGPWPKTVRKSPPDGPKRVPKPHGVPALAEVAPNLVRIVPEGTSDLARLTDSFHLNLTAFGLLSFAVGLFIVHAAIGLAFEQRRPMFRTLRALGLPTRHLVILLAVETLVLALVAGLIWPTLRPNSPVADPPHATTDNRSRTRYCA